MAYKAYIDNHILFFDSSVQDESFLLTAATLNLQFGGSGDFTFVIPKSNQYYDDFYRLTTYVDVYRDDQLLFAGRVYSIKENFDLQREIKCEGILSVLADSIFRPTLYDGSLRGLVDLILASHNSQVEDDKIIIPGIITVPNSDCYRDYKNYETSINRLADLVETFGGYLYVTKEYNSHMTSVVDIGIVDEAIVDVGTNGSVLTLNWVPDAPSVCDQTIDLTENLLDIKQTVDASEVFTVLIPLGSDDDTEDGNRITIESVNSGKDYLTASQAYLNMYGYITQTQVWDDVHVPSILKTKGQEYLSAALTPKTTINLSAVDLANAGYDIESFSIGQKIIVNSEPHGIENMQFTCHKQRLNLLNPSQNTLSLGEAVQGYVQVNSKNSASVVLEQAAQKYAPKAAVQLAINQATALITGNTGGYVVLHDSDEDGYPDEILVMDKPDIDTAEKVWRWNKSGLGYSSTGYDGTFGLAMTINGEIVADYVSTGVMTADVIKAGILTGQTGDSYWNFATGEVYIDGTIKANLGEIGGWSIDTNSLYSLVNSDEYRVSLHSPSFSNSYVFSVRKYETEPNPHTTYPFYIQANGYLHAESAYIGGTINTSNLYASGRIHIDSDGQEQDSITLNYSNATTFLNSDRLTFTGGTYESSGRYHAQYSTNGVIFSRKTSESGTSESLGSYTTDGFTIASASSPNNHAIIGWATRDGGLLDVYPSSGNRTIELRGSNGQITCVSLTQTSDQQAKKNIKPLDLEKSAEFIYALTPAEFEYKNFDSGSHHGFVAQPVEEIVDKHYNGRNWELVSTPEEGYKSLSYTELIADMIATIQHQNERIKALEKEKA